jgi:hypothetical protein
MPDLMADSLAAMEYMYFEDKPMRYTAQELREALERAADPNSPAPGEKELEILRWLAKNIENFLKEVNGELPFLKLPSEQEIAKGRDT